MPRRAFPSASLAAAVRAHFKLTQAELAAFVGVSRPLLAAVEAGRKNLGPGPDRRLQVLARPLPPPDGWGPPAPTFANEAGAGLLPAAEQEPLRRRLGRCEWRRTRLLHQLGSRQQPGQARHERRRWAVQVLGPALAAPLPAPDWLRPGGPGPLPPYPLATPDAARDTHWLAGLALRLAAATAPLPPAARALAQARLAGLEAGLAALRATLGSPG